MGKEKNLSCPQCGRKYAEPADRCPLDGSPLYGPEVLERLGIQLNNYKVLSIIGEGGMGVVYRGEHAVLGKPVAIKVLHERFARREGALEQFLREAQAASRIRHPNIVDVTDFGQAPDGSVYFVMEFLEGESLEDILGRQHHLELFNAVNVVRQIARALAAAHDHGVVHLDLKPENIYLINREGRRRIVRQVESNGGDKRFVVEKEGNYDFVKLLDFGVAKFIHENLGPGLGTRSGMVFGTPHYMSPEQARGEAVDGRSDVYSLGILFYEMVTGEVPFDGEVALDILNGHVSGTVVPPSQVNPAIKVDPGTNATILHCLEKNAGDRYQTMDELCDALLNCFTDRVFLRDAERLPGAVEAGIVPPKPPEAGPRRPPTPHSKRAERSTSLTDELAELFGGSEDGASTDPELAEMIPEAPAAPQEEEAELDKRETSPRLRPERRTNPGIGKSSASGSKKRRATAPLVSRGKKDTAR